MTRRRPIRAVLWDFGGVITTSPFTAFNAYEAEAELPKDFIRGLNATNPDANAWARLERNDVDPGQFCDLFEAEARAAGHSLDARHVLTILHGAARPEMVAAVRALAGRYKTACLTNNMNTDPRPPDRAREIAEIMALFDLVVESSKIGVRKPDPRFYEIACEMLAVDPAEAVFLDDLGINLKPARALGMHTIKVGAPDQALADLEACLGHSLR